MRLRHLLGWSVVRPSVKYAGTYVSEAMLERVKLNSTTSEWLVAAWKEPTGRTTLTDGTEIWKWSYQPVEEQTSNVTVWSTGGPSEPKVK